MLSPDDVALTAGCSQLELPRLIGITTAVVDGVQMNFTYRMMAMDWSTLYGIMEIGTVVHGRHPGRGPSHGVDARKGAVN